MTYKKEQTKEETPVRQIAKNTDTEKRYTQ